MLFLDVLEEAVILYYYVIDYFVHLLQRSLSLGHDTLTAVARVL